MAIHNIPFKKQLKIYIILIFSLALFYFLGTAIQETNQTDRAYYEAKALRDSVAEAAQDSLRAITQAKIDSIWEAGERNKAKMALSRLASDWTTGYYVDEFGNNTGGRYMTNRSSIEGTFSNSATENSRLKVDLLIEAPKLIYIMLYEYGGNNPVKKFGRTPYSIAIQDAHKNQFRVSGYNSSSDRITLIQGAAETLHTALIKGGTVMLSITDDDYGLTSYRFTVDARGYEQAFITKLGSK